MGVAQRNTYEGGREVQIGEKGIIHTLKDL